MDWTDLFRFRLLFSALDVTLVPLSNLALFFVPGMQNHPVAESDALTSAQLQIAGLFILQLLEIVAAKRIGREQPIIPHVPPGRVPRVLRMIEKSDSNGLALGGPIIIAPIGPLAPGVVVALAFAVDDMSFAALEAHGLGESDSHHPVFVV